MAIPLCTAPLSAVTKNSSNGSSLKKKAPVDQQDNDGHPPWLLAIKYGRFDAAACLQSHGSSPLCKNNIGQNAFHLIMAVTNGWEELLKLLTDEQQLFLFNQKDNEGKTLLHCAAITADENLLAVLCQKFPQFINAETCYGYTPLYYAIQAKRENFVICVLLKFNADPSIMTKHGTSALHLARELKNTELAELLLRAILEPYQLPKKSCAALIDLGNLFDQPDARAAIFLASQVPEKIDPATIILVKNKETVTAHWNREKTERSCILELDQKDLIKFKFPTNNAIVKFNEATHRRLFNKITAVCGLSDFSNQATGFLTSKKAYYGSASGLNLEQAITVVWALLEWSDLLIYKANQLFLELKEHEAQKIENTRKIEQGESKLKTAMFNLVCRASGVIAFCRQLKVTLPLNLQNRVDRQAQRALVSLWIFHSKKEAPNFKSALENLEGFREKLKKHRQKYYSLSSESPLPKLTKPSEKHVFLAQQWGKENQAFFIQFTADLFALALEITGIKLPPYVLLAAGSLSKQEMSLRSDIEYLILLDELTPKIRQQVMLVCSVFNYLVTFLGETNVKITLSESKELHLSCAGYCIDHGGNEPVSNSAFISTPKKLAEAVVNEFELLTKTVLFSVCKITGEDRIFNDYKRFLKEFSSQCIVNAILLSYRQYWFQQCAVTLLEDNLSAFNLHTKNKDAIQSIEPALNVKVELLRPISQLLGDLCLFYGLITEGMTTWERLNLLRDKGFISKENHYYFSYVLNVAYQLRIKTHGFYEEECENLYPLECLSGPSKKLCIDEPLKEALINCFRILVPLHEMAEKFYKAVKENLTNKPRIFLTEICFQEKAQWVAAQAFERVLRDPKKVEEYYNQALRMNPKDTQLRIQHVCFLLMQQSLELTKQLPHQQNQIEEKSIHEEQPLTKHLMKRKQFVAQLVEMLAATANTAGPFSKIYQQLPRECRADFLEELVKHTQLPNRSYLMPILKELYQISDGSVSNERELKLKRWQERFSTIAERVSKEKTKGRVLISGPLLPEHECWVLKTNVAAELFDENFEFQEDKNLQGSRKVRRVGNLFFKKDPEMPGMSYLVESFHEFMGIENATSESEVVKLQLPNGETLPVLISNAIEGKTLQDVLSHEAEEIDKLDLDLFCELVIVSLMLHPEDGIPNNYIFHKLPNGKWTLVSIDHDHYLFPAWMEKNKKNVLQLKNILWCLPQMQKIIPQAVIEKFLKLNCKDILTKWLNDAQVQNAFYQQFGKETLENWHKKHSSTFNILNSNNQGGTTCAIPIKRGDAPQISERWMTILYLFNLHKEITCEQLLFHLQPRIGLAYHEAKGTPIEKLIALGNYPTDKGVVVSNSKALVTLQVETLFGVSCLKLQDLSPEEALLELDQLHLQTQALKITRQQAEQGVFTQYQQLFLPRHKQMILFGSNAKNDGLQKAMDWGKLSLEQTNLLLNILSKEKTPFTQIEIMDCRHLPLEKLLELLRYSPDLKILRLAKHPLLDATALKLIQEICPCLEELSLMNMPNLRGEISVFCANLKRLTLKQNPFTQLTLNTPKLAYLRCMENNKLIAIKQMPNSVRYMDVSRCTSLESLQSDNFSECQSLEIFKAEGATKLKYAKELMKMPYLILLIQTPIESAIHKLAEIFKPENKTLNLEALRLSLERSEVFKSYQRKFIEIKENYKIERTKYKTNYSEEEIKRLLKILLDDKDNSVRWKVAERIFFRSGIATNEKSIKFLLKSLSANKNKSIQVIAAIILCHLGVVSEPVISTIQQALNEEPNWEIKILIVELLCKNFKGNTQVTNVLLKILDEVKSPKILICVARALGSSGIAIEQVTRVLLKILRKGNRYAEGERGSAAEILGELGISSEEIINALVLVMIENNKDHYNNLGASAVRALKKIGADNEQVLNSFLEVLIEGQHWQVQGAVARVLGSRGIVSEPIINALVKALLENSSSSVQVGAALALIQLEVDSEKIISAFLKIMNETPNSLLRFFAAEALVFLGYASDQINNALIIIMDENRNEDKECRTTSLGSLGLLGLKNSNTENDLRRNLEIFPKYCIGLIAFGDDIKEHEVSLWHTALVFEGWSDMHYCWKAFEYLVQIKEIPESILIKAKLLNDKSSAARVRQVFICLGEQGHDFILEKLLNFLNQRLDLTTIRDRSDFIHKKSLIKDTLMSVSLQCFLQGFLATKEPVNLLQPNILTPEIFVSMTQRNLKQLSEKKPDNSEIINPSNSKQEQIINPSKVSQSIFYYSGESKSQNIEEISLLKSPPSGLLRFARNDDDSNSTPSGLLRRFAPRNDEVSSSPPSGLRRFAPRNDEVSNSPSFGLSRFVSRNDNDSNSPPPGLSYFAPRNDDDSNSTLSGLSYFAPRNDEVSNSTSFGFGCFACNDMSGKLQHRNETIHFNFELQKAAGEGDCAVIASPFKDRKEICHLLWKAVEEPKKRILMQDEIREAIINEKFLLEEDEKTWENFQIQQLPYHEAHGIYQMTVKEIQEMLKEKSIKNDDLKDIDLLNFLENNNEYSKEFKELSQLKKILEEQQQIFDKIEIERQQFLSSPTVCQSYIKIIVANEKQWIGKGALFLAAKEKGDVNLCIWQEQENSDELTLDESYSYLGNPQPQFHHVVYRHGAIHYDLLIEKPLELINTNVNQTNDIKTFGN